MTRKGGTRATAALLFEGFPETVSRELASLIDDVVAILFEREPTRFLNAHYVPVDGAEQSLVRWQFDRAAFQVAFDSEFFATLRARGFELPSREVIRHLSHS
jgi:hypothetical protein